MEINEKDVLRIKERNKRLLAYDPDQYVQLIWDKRGKTQWLTEVFDKKHLTPEFDGKIIPSILKLSDKSKTYIAYCLYTIEDNKFVLDYIHPSVVKKNEESGVNVYKIIAEFQFSIDGTVVNEIRRGKRYTNTGYVFPDIWIGYENFSQVKHQEEDTV